MPQKVGNGSVLIGMEYVNTMFPGSLCLKYFILTNIMLYITYYSKKKITTFSRKIRRYQDVLPAVSPNSVMSLNPNYLNQIADFC